MKPSRKASVRQAKYSGKNTFNIYADTSSVFDFIDNLQEGIEKAVRPAAQAAAQVLYDDAVKNVDSIGKVSGNLRSAIYQAFSADNSGELKATYHISWNAKTAPHGHLVEFGHIQRYKHYLAKNGNFYPVVRPEMRGNPKPRRRASQAEKDAYYVLLDTPKQIAAKPFIRKASERFEEALDAANDRLLYELNKDYM